MRLSLQAQGAFEVDRPVNSRLDSPAMTQPRLSESAGALCGSGNPSQHPSEKNAPAASAESAIGIASMEHAGRVRVALA
jgi:hypothetical protein